MKETANMSYGLMQYTVDNWPVVALVALAIACFFSYYYYRKKKQDNQQA